MNVKRHTEKFIINIMKQELKRLTFEKSYAVFINDEGLPFHIKCLAEGDRKTVSIDLGELEIELISLAPKAIYIVHNHPGGVPVASYSDDSYTRNVIKLCEKTGVELIDHIIIMGTNPKTKVPGFKKGLPLHYSYRDRLPRYAKKFEATKPVTK